MRVKILDLSMNLEKVNREKEEEKQKFQKLNKEKTEESR